MPVKMRETVIANQSGKPHFFNFSVGLFKSVAIIAATSKVSTSAEP